MKKFLFASLLVFGLSARSQNDAVQLNNLIRSDIDFSNALFSNTDTVRKAILLASVWPQGLVRLGDIQKTSSADFRDLVSHFNRTKQKELWEISRYSELPGILIRNKDRNEKELNEILKKYPKEIRENAVHFCKNDFNIIYGMEKIHREFEENYSGAVKDFPAEVQRAYATLLHYPELVSMMTEEIKNVISLGDIYRRNPALVQRAGDSLNLVLARERGAEFEDWKKGISKDTAAQRELKQASGNYAREENEDDVYASPGTEVHPPAAVNSAPYADGFLPYPYWAGYPYWYTNPYWYPYPWYAHGGFYWDPLGAMIFWGLPSYHFGAWFYNHPDNFRRYPHAARYFDAHYQGHPRTGSGFNYSMRQSNGGRPGGGFGGRVGGGFGGGGGGHFGGRR